MEFPVRKSPRLPFYNYSSPGAYFITICTQNRKNILARIVGGGVLDAPSICLSPTGQIVEQRLLSANQIYNVIIDKYVVMPNHVHILIFIHPHASHTASVPSNQSIPRFVSGFKRLCNQSVGHPIFQRSYHDHVIRNERDYQRIWQYIDNNPALWEKDCFYTE